MSRPKKDATDFWLPSAAACQPLWTSQRSHRDIRIRLLRLQRRASGQRRADRELVQASRYTITHDAWIALAGATAGEPGVIAIAGTGSMAFGRNREDRTARAGGWGYAFGDEGSAFDLVRQALRAVLRSEEGWGPRTALRELLLESTGATDANALLHLFYTAEYPRQRVASFAPLVDQAAAAGDPVAQDILKHAAQSLATFVAAVRDQLFGPRETVRRELHRRSVPEPRPARTVPDVGGTGRRQSGSCLPVTVRRQGRCWRRIGPPASRVR